MEAAKQRDSRYELLKIIAMVFIVVSHVNPHYLGGAVHISDIFLSKATSDINTVLILFLRDLGPIGDIIFVSCSSFFLLERDEIKSTKAVMIAVNTFIISVIYLVISIAAGLDVSKSEMIKALLPITHGLDWFIGCYLILYIIHPVLNKAIHNMTKRQLLMFNIFLVILYSLLQGVFKNKYYYTGLVGFIVLYFITAYFKYHLKNFSMSKKANRIFVLLGIAFIVVPTVLIEIARQKISFFSNRQLIFTYIMNPAFMVLCFGMLNLFRNLKSFYNKYINYISSLSLFIYLIHENYFARSKMRYIVFDQIYKNFGYKYIFCWSILVALITYVLCVFIAFVYKRTIEMIIKKPVNTCCVYMETNLHKIVDILVKID